MLQVSEHLRENARLRYFAPVEQHRAAAERLKEVEIVLDDDANAIEVAQERAHLVYGCWMQPGNRLIEQQNTWGAYRSHGKRQ
ncbi:MAG: hypothetical protein R3C25_10280 [Hyphomonadaceae bacterium]